MLFPLSDTPEGVVLPFKLNYFRPIIGILLLLLLFSFCWETAGFDRQAQLAVLQQKKGFSHWLYAAMKILLTQKISSVLLILFGCSLYVTVMYNRSSDRFDFLLRRQLWLLLLGVVNAFVFLFRGDFLFFMGVLGILFFVFARLPARQLFMMSALFGLLYMGKLYWYYADDKTAYEKYAVVMAIEKKWPKDTAKKAKSDTLTTKQQGDKDAWEGIVKSKKYDSAGVKAAIAAMQSTNYAENLKYVLEPAKYEQSVWIFKNGIWMGGMLVLLGMALVQVGFFNGNVSPRSKLLLAGAAFALGAALGYAQLQARIQVAADYQKFLTTHILPPDIGHPVELVCIAVGWLSLLSALADRARGLWSVFSAIGSMPVTIYLLQCGITALFFSGYGFDYYANFSVGGLVVYALELNLLLVVFAVVWTRYFAMGPVEYFLSWAITGSSTKLQHEPA